MGTLRRFCVAFVVLSTLLGAVRAFAASIDTPSATLGGGETAVAACQSSPLGVSYKTAYDPELSGYGVSGLVVTGFDPASCANKAYKVSLIGPGGSQLAEATGTTPASGTSFSPSLAGSHVAAGAVSGVSVTITG